MTEYGKKCHLLSDRVATGQTGEKKWSFGFDSESKTEMICLKGEQVIRVLISDSEERGGDSELRYEGTVYIKGKCCSFTLQMTVNLQHHVKH